MNKRTAITLAPMMALVLMGASECGTEDRTPTTCTITSRDTATISIKCSDSTTYNVDAPSDLYPKCQVGQPWEGCKW